MTDLQDLNDAVLDKFGHSHGDESVVKLIELFLEYVPNNISTAVAAEKTGDLIAVERAVHSLKSSSGNIGAEALQELSSQIERLASERTGKPIMPLMRQLETTFARLKPLLEIKKKGLEK